MKMANLEERLKQIDDIRKTVQHCENQLNGLLKELGWTKDKLPKPKISKVTTESDITGSSSDACKEKNESKPLSKPNDLEDVVNLCSKIDEKRTSISNFTDLNKLKRDLKRRRIKYRTTKTAPLTYTEELHELINLQMELLRENKEK